VVQREPGPIADLSRAGATATAIDIIDLALPCTPGRRASGRTRPARSANFRRYRDGLGADRRRAILRSSIRTRSVAPSEIPTLTRSRSGKPPTHREIGGPPTGYRSTPAGNPTEARLLDVTRTAVAPDPEGSAELATTGTGTDAAWVLPRAELIAAAPPWQPSSDPWVE
jgi:hypothetical protein